ncbi:MAG: cytochrome c3 family protein [Sphingomonadaceae bacterium]
MRARMLPRTTRSVESRLAVALAVMAAALAATFAIAGPALAEPNLQPKTTHEIQGRENCLTCHPVGGGAKPSPASHAAYDNTTCLGCHPAASAAPAPAKPEARPPSEPRPEPAQPQAPPTGAAQPAPAERQEAAASEQPAEEASKTAAAPSTAPGPTCIDCHKNPDLSMPLGNGEKLSLFVDEAEMAKSVHQGKLTCTDCHSRITGFPHKKVQFGSKREYSIAQYEACKRCHFANYTKTLDSMHYKVMASGNQDAPLCTDCHGYHNVSVPDEPRAKISQSCGKCHADTYTVYSESVHGAALANGDGQDVPVCTDCHGTHVIADTGSASFRLNTPEMCAKCHADPTMMGKYGLSPNVFKTYAQDFHGATVALTKKQGSDSRTNVAVCSDCHGVHDIKSVKNTDPAQLRQDVMAACQKCHPNARSNFPDAWLGHYELNLEKNPLPFLVRSFYWVMIPFMLTGLMLHIVVDLWRIARNR